MSEYSKESVSNLFYELVDAIIIVDAKNEAQGRQVFKAINPTYTDAQIDELVSSVKESAKSETTVSKVKFFTKKLRYPILFAFLIAAFVRATFFLSSTILIFFSNNVNCDLK